MDSQQGMPIMRYRSDPYRRAVSWIASNERAATMSDIIDLHSTKVVASAWDRDPASVASDVMIARRRNPAPPTHQPTAR